MSRVIGDVERIRFQQATFQAKLVKSLAIVAHALSRCRKPYIAFSGGKDSLCVMALVHRVREVELHWSDDELEYPELVEYMTMMQQLAGPLFVTTLGRATHAHWFTPWQDRPYWRDPLPAVHTDTVCGDDWQEGRGYDAVFLGLRMEENRRRRDWLIQAGPRYRKGLTWRINPIWDWSADDVWALIAGWGIPYCAAYDVYERIGVPRHRQRIGPLPLAPRQHLEDGWPDTLARLEARYGQHWR